MRQNREPIPGTEPELTGQPVATELLRQLPEVIEQPRQGIELSASHYLWLLRTNALKMAVFVVLVLIATTMVTLRLTRIYESTAMLYVDRGAVKNIVGQDSQANSGSAADADSFIASQMRILQSDAVARPLAEKYNLLERERQIDPARDDREKQIKVRSAPIVLKELRISRVPNSYVIQISYRSSDPGIATAVANGIALSYIEHIYDTRISSSESLSKFMTRQLEGLRAKTEASGARVAALEQELNMINPEEKTNILSSRLIQLNTEYTKVQADRVRAEAANNSLQASSLEGGLISVHGDELRAAVKRLNEARERFADVKARYGVNHPEYDRLQATVTELENQVESTGLLIKKQAAKEYERDRDQELLLAKHVVDTKAEYDHLNLKSAEYQRAKQEADGDRKLYEELVRKIREDQINAGFQNDMIRIADVARPASRPVEPNVPMTLAVAFLLSSVLAVIVVIAIDQMDTTIKDPDQVARILGARVVGTLPALKHLRGVDVLQPRVSGAGSRKGFDQGGRSLNAFGEAIRTLRNSILLTDFDHRLRSILLTSASPSEGKSTVAAHLAVSHAQQGYKTLLIDGDMRRPSQHRLFGIQNTAGLSNVTDGSTSWRDVLTRPIAGIDLYVMPAGPGTSRGDDRLGHVLPALLEEACGEFQLVVLDAPPLLGFPEPLQMACFVDGVVVVTRAGKTDRTAVAAVLNTLRELRANVVGLVLNDVRKEMSSSYHHYYGNYGKYYAKRKNDAPLA